MNESLHRYLVKSCLLKEKQCDEKDVKLQTFVLKQTLVGGSTIGPYIASQTGITTIDLGNPMLSMHSIREMVGADDVVYMMDLIRSVYCHFPSLTN